MVGVVDTSTTKSAESDNGCDSAKHASGCKKEKKQRMFGAHTGGGVAIIVALSLPVLIGFASLAAEFTQGLLVQLRNQRTADLAAYAAATAYISTQSTASINPVAKRVGQLNGVAPGDVSANLVNSPSGSGNKAVQVDIQTDVPLLLSKLIKPRLTTLAVGATSFAEVVTGTATSSACLLALSSSGAGISLSGGTSIDASSCTVASNNTVSLTCGTTITTKSVVYASSITDPCGGITSPSGGAVKRTKASTDDPLAANPSVIAAVGRISSVNAWTPPGPPTVNGVSDLEFGWDEAATKAQASKIGCTAHLVSYTTWVLTCPNGGAYNFGNVTNTGWLAVNFNVSGAASTVYNIKSLNLTGPAVNFGPGTYNIAQGVIVAGGMTTTFGAGTFNIGRARTACDGGGRFSICNPNGSTMEFGGPSNFILAGGVFNGGQSTLTLGAGTTNSYQIGPSSTGEAFRAYGGSTTRFGGVGGSPGVFQVSGNFRTDGGSCVILGAAAQYDVDGNFSLSGGAVLGSGVYTTTGYAAFGDQAGGDITCGGQTGVRGSGVSFVIGAASAPSSGPCTGAAFCVAAGYGNVSLTAPTTGQMGKLLIIGPTSSSNTRSAIFNEGAIATSLSGAVYFPYGRVYVSGGGQIGDAPPNCLQLIGSEVILDAGGVAATSCVDGPSAAPTVQIVK